MRKTQTVILFLLLSILCIGCATTRNDFFGIGINNVYSAKDFTIRSYSKEGVQYDCDHCTMNSNISAWAEVNWAGLEVMVKNDTDSPIATNYYLDSFSLIAKDGKEFRLGKIFYDENYINPGRTICYYLSTPFDGFSTDMKRVKEETAMIICELGSPSDKVIIVLKPLPKG